MDDKASLLCFGFNVGLKGKAGIIARFFYLQLPVVQNEKIHAVKFLIQTNITMSSTPPNAFGEPTQPADDFQKLKDVKLEISRIEKEVSTIPDLLYSDILGYTMRLAYLRKEARKLEKLTTYEPK